VIYIFRLHRLPVFVRNSTVVQNAPTSEGIAREVFEPRVMLVEEIDAFRSDPLHSADSQPSVAATGAQHVHEE